MRLDRLEIRGFNHFETPCMLNIAELPHGLIAIQGQNGAGKTTTLDAALAGLFGPGAANRAFPSREGTLAQYATSREAYIDSLWTLEGKGQYRARVNVDSQSRKTDAVLLRVEPSGREVPLNDGKVTTYRDVIASIFPSQKSVLASAFASQNKRGSFGELGQSERLALFRELADLEHLETKSQTAKRCQQVADGIAGRIRSALDVLRQGVTPEQLALLAAAHEELVLGLGELTWQRAEAVNRLTAAEAVRASSQQAAQAHVAAQATVDGLRQALARIEADLAALDPSTLERAYTASFGQIDGRYRAAMKRIAVRRQSLVSAYDLAVEDRQERIVNNEKLLADGDTIRQAIERTKKAEQEIVSLHEKETAVRREQDHVWEQIASTQIDLDKSTAAVKELEAVRRRAGLLTTVKFGDECGIDPVCPLVTDAVSARQRIPELEDVASQVQTLETAIYLWREKGLRAGEDLALIAHNVTKTQRVISLCEPFVKRAAYLDAATTRIAEYRRDAMTAETSHATALLGLDTETRQVEETKRSETASAVELNERQIKEMNVRRAELTTESSRLRAEYKIAALEDERTVGASAQLAEAERECKAAQYAISDMDATAARLETELKHATRQQADFTHRQAQTDDAERRLRIVEDEMLAWQVLAKALGREGIQRIEIDSSGPQISSIANTLLEVGFGTRYQIQIVTQVATASGKDTKEKFVVEVLDQLHGGEAREMGDLSGGEKTIIEEGLRAAISAYVNLRSRQPIRTFFRDECTGSLSPENVGPYIALLRKLRELSGVQTILFATHSMEAAELADAVVEIEQGKVKSIRR